MRSSPVATACALRPLSALLLAALLAGPALAAGPVRERLSLDKGWRFHLGNAADPDKDFGFGLGQGFAKAGEADGPAAPGFGDSTWRQVDVPHDWAVELPFDSNADLMHGFHPIGRRYPATSVGWYRRNFEIPASDRGKRLTVVFDGVFRNSMAWLNGNYLGRNLSGYTGFSYDITDVAHYGGNNVLVVRVDATQYEGWFYEGAGIYRHVWLLKRSPLHIAQGGAFVAPSVTGSSASLSVATQLVNAQDTSQSCTVSLSVSDRTGRRVASGSSSNVDLGPWERRTVVQTLSLPDARLWSLEEPYLYGLQTTVMAGGTESDAVETPFGVRTIRFDKDNGFFLNGKRVELKGTCNHQDYAGVGSAMPDRLQYYRIEKLKEMGCNAIRTSHNDPTPELMDACDRLGVLVMDEHRMIGSSPEIVNELTTLVKRDRNHPSVILWSIGNEEPEEGTGIGERVAITMKRVVHDLDPTRPVTAAANNGNQYPGLNSVVDVRGWNYRWTGDIDAYHRDHPDQPMFGSEEGSTVSDRGIYANDRAGGYVTSFGTGVEGWWQFYDARPFLAGAFDWTGFDYRGEPTPYGWPCISSHFGILDTCGFPKDVFYYYQSWWTRKPVLHLFPHWTWPGHEGKPVTVWCYSNCPQVELFLNGKSLGIQIMNQNSHLEWTVPYEPGVLEARGYREGRVIATAREETTGAPAEVALIPDRGRIQADGEDLSVVRVEVRDAHGRLVPTASNEVTFRVAGPAKLIGVGNGDPSCHEPDTYVPETLRQPVDTWRMRVVNGVKNRPETAPDFDDSAWPEVNARVPVGAISRENQAAVYRTVVHLTESDLKAGWHTLVFNRIDDLGWVYVNGRLIAKTTDWSRVYAIDAGQALRPGRNVIVVVVQNIGGSGGLALGVDLTAQVTPVWKRSAFNGLCMALVQSTGRPGTVTVTAEAPGLRPARARIDCAPATPIPSVP